MRYQAVAAALLAIATSSQAAVVYVDGFETWDAGRGVETGAAFDYAPPYGRNGLGLEVDAGAVEASWCVDLADYTAEVGKVGARVYVDADQVAATLGVTQSRVFAYIGQGVGGNTPGCVVVLSENAGGIVARVEYLGTLDFPVTLGAVDIGAGWQDIGLWQENLTADSVACGLTTGGGTPRFNVTQGLPAGKVTEDVARVCLGTPDPTLGLPNDPATAWFDDLAIDDAATPGPGRVLVVHPRAQYDQNWSSNPNGCGAGEVSPEGCVDDWEVGVFNSCTDAGVGNYRQKGSGTGEDTYFTDPLAALTTGETLAGVHLVHRVCNNHGGGGNAKLAPRYTYDAAACGSDVDCNASAGTCDALRCDYDGPEIDIADADNKWMTGVWQVNPHHGGAWVPTDFDLGGAVFGHYKRTNSSPNNGNPAATAFLAYIDTRTPTSSPDRTLLDPRGAGGVPDGVITYCANGDSISAGTGGSTCGCSVSCLVDGDCAALASPISPELNPPICSGGFCQVPCGTSRDCANCPLGQGSTCPSAAQYVSRVCNTETNFDTCWNCARSGATSEDITADLLACIDDPRACGRCILIKGDAGLCSGGTQDGATCKTAGDCPGGSCVGYPCDYATTIVGTNNTSSMSPTKCAFSPFEAAVVNTSSYNERACPLAEVGATGYACERISCTTQSDCNAAYGAGSGSACAGSCAGHDDPVWPCAADSYCGSCSQDATRQCFSGGLGTITCNTGGTANTCTAGTCDTGTKYCTCPASSVSCAADSDCEAPGGGLGGRCVGGACTNAGHSSWADTAPKICIGGTQAGNSCSFNQDCDSAVCAIDPELDTVWRRRRDSLGHNAASIMAQMDTMAAAAEAKGTRVLHLTNVTQTSEPGALVGSQTTHWTTRELRQIQLQREHVVDMFWPFLHRDARSFQQDAIRFKHGLCRGDRWHVIECGAGFMADALLAWTGAAISVCSDDPTVPCQYCSVQCTGPADCNGAACDAGTCGCATDLDCGAGTCEDVGGGTMRCVVTTIDDCAPANALGSRQLLATNSVCAAGTCTNQRTGPRCTSSLVDCTTTADCAGEDFGDVCALDGAHIRCTYDGLCRDGGPWPNDICGAEAVCEQPAL